MRTPSARPTKPIFLCGFMGVGKSTVGALVAKALNLPGLDSDSELTRLANQSIAEIFSNKGEAEFRRLEEETLETLTSRMAVISLGGGALGSEKSREAIRRAGTLIYLAASVDTLMARLKPEAKRRPLLAGLNESEMRTKIRTLLEERRPLYEASDFRIETDGRSEREVADEIVRTIGELK